MCVYEVAHREALVVAHHLARIMPLCETIAELQQLLAQLGLKDTQLGLRR